ncbi:UNVERIFIED_CONTAM: hypothetical protein HHA_259880 [Hammondia hammondi]|eukprot:XP_008883049.1 hypothetical protein HHA_259880 [Hammondia hammondi]
MEFLDQATLATLATFLLSNELPKLRLLSKALNGRLFPVDSFRRLMREPRSLVFPAEWGQEKLDTVKIRGKRARRFEEGNQRVQRGAVAEASEVHGVTASSPVSLDVPVSSVAPSRRDFNYLRVLVNLPPPPPHLLHLTLHIPENLRTVTRSWLRTYHQLLCVAAPHLETLQLVEFFSARLGKDLMVRDRAVHDEDENTDTSCSADTSNQRESVQESDAVTPENQENQEEAPVCSCQWTPPKKHEALPFPAFPRLRFLAVRNRGGWSVHPPLPCAFTYLFLGDLQTCDSSHKSSESTTPSQAFPVLKDIRFLEFTTIGLALFRQFLVKHNVTSAEHLAIGMWHMSPLQDFLLFLVRENAKPKRRFRRLRSLDVHGAGFIWPPDEFWYFFSRSWCNFTQIWKEHFLQHSSDSDRVDARRRASALCDDHWTSCPKDWSTCPDEWGADNDPLLRVNEGDCEPRDEDLVEDGGTINDEFLSDAGEEGQDRESIVCMLKRLPCLRRVLLSGFVGMFVTEEADEAIRFFEDIFPQAVVDVEGEIIVSTNALLEAVVQATAHPEWVSRLESFMARKREQRAQVTQETRSRASPWTEDFDRSGVTAAAVGAPNSELSTSNAEPERDDENEYLALEGRRYDERHWEALDGVFLSERGKENFGRWLALGVIEDVYIEVSDPTYPKVHLQTNSFHRHCVATYYRCLELPSTKMQHPVGQDWGLPAVSVRHVEQWGTKYVQDFLDIVSTFRHVILNLDYVFWTDRREHVDTSAERSLGSEAGETCGTSSDGNLVQSDAPCALTDGRAQDVHDVAKADFSVDQESSETGAEPPPVVSADRRFHQCSGSASPADGASSRSSDAGGERLVASDRTAHQGSKEVVRLGEFGGHFPNVVGLLLPLYWMDDATWSSDEIARIAEKYRSQTQVVCIKNLFPIMGENATEDDPMSLMARDFEIVTRICRDTLRVIDYRVYSFFSWKDELGLDENTLIPQFLKEFVANNPEFTLAKRLDSPSMTQAGVVTVGQEALCQLRVYIWIKRDVL